MKTFFQKTSLHLLLAATVFAGLGFVYAALPEVNPEDNLTDTAWNNVIGAINNFSFDSGNVGIGVETPGSNLTILADQNTSSISLVRADGTSAMTSGSFLGGANSFLRLHNTDGSIGTQLSTHPYSIPTYFNSTSVGIGTTTPDSGLKLDVEGKIGATEYCDENGANCTLATNLGSGGGSGGKFVDGTIATDAAFTGGNVGIGTNDPANTFTVQSNLSGYGGSINNDNGYGLQLTAKDYPLLVLNTDNVVGGSKRVGQFRRSDTGASTSHGIFFEVEDSQDSWIYASGSIGNRNLHLGGSSSAKAITVQSTGNVGIGTTAPSQELHIMGDIGNSNNPTVWIDTDGSNAALAFGTNTAYSWIQGHGSSPLYINELGNNTIINPAGSNVGIGTTSPVRKLTVRTGSWDGIQLENTVDSLIAGGMRWTPDNYFQGRRWMMFTNDTPNSVGTGNDGGLAFRTNSGSTPGTTALRMMIADNGNVGIGTSSILPQTRLHIMEGGTRFTLNAPSQAAEGREIDANGRSTQAYFTQSGAANFFWGASGQTYLSFRNTNNAAIGSIAFNGGSGINYNTTSDARLKQNFSSLENSLDKLSQIEVLNYEYKESPGISQVGFIAQNIRELAPYAVSGEEIDLALDDENKDGLPDNPLQLDYSKLVPLLTGAIQELTIEKDLEIKDLQKQLKDIRDILENNNIRSQ